MLELYHHNISVCAQKVRLALEEKRIAWTGREVDLLRGQQLSPEFRAINPKAVVPAIVHDGAPVAESTVILEYLDDAFPDRPLRPAAPLARARMRSWTQVPDAGIHAHCGTLSFAAAFARQVKSFHGEAAIAQRIAKLPDRARAARQAMLFEKGIAAPIVPESVKAHDKMLADMETALAAQPWLGGDGFSLAECAILPYVLRLEKLGLSGLWAQRPKVQDWYARAKARPSWKTAILAFPSAGAPDYDDDLVTQKIDVWPQVKALLAA